MADSWKLTTVTGAIDDASITVTNAAGNSVTLAIKNETNAPFIVEQEACPMLKPRIDNFITRKGEFMTRDSHGADAGLKSVHYTLHYCFFFAPALQGPDILTHYGDSVAAMVATLLYFMTHTNSISGATEIIPHIDNFAPQADGNKTLFHGGEISFDIDQYLET